MDNLTHALTGAALARAGLDRLTPLATATLVVAANAPDVDVLAYLGGSFHGLAHRRGITHGVPALAVLPFAVAGAMLAWDRWVRRRRAPGAPAAKPLPLLALAAVGLVTHPVLDWMNNYGMRWWLPFDGRWSWGDSLFIIDPWLWLTLGAAVYLTGTWRPRAHLLWSVPAAVGTLLMLAGPVPAAARAAWGVALLGLLAARWLRPRPAPRGVAALLVTLALVYGAAMMAGSALAEREGRAAALAADLPGVSEVMAAPRAADPATRDLIVRTSEGYVSGTHRWGERPRVRLATGETLPFLAGPPGMGHEVLTRLAELARGDERARDYLTWSRFPYVQVSREREGYRVRIADVRYHERGTGSLGGLDVWLPLGAGSAAEAPAQDPSGGSSAPPPL